VQALYTEITRQGAAVGALQNDFISDLVPPGTVAYTGEVPHVKTLVFFLLHVYWACFAAVKLNTRYAILVEVPLARNPRCGLSRALEMS